MEHAQGKWELSLTYDKRQGVRTENGFICFLLKPFHYTGQDERYKDELAETEANARLIVAAPDLLDACKKYIEAVDGITSGIVDRKALATHNIRQAIAKAEN